MKSVSGGAARYYGKGPFPSEQCTGTAARAIDSENSCGRHGEEKERESFEGDKQRQTDRERARERQQKEMERIRETGSWSEPVSQHASEPEPFLVTM